MINLQKRDYVAESRRKLKNFETEVKRSQKANKQTLDSADLKLAGLCTHSLVSELPVLADLLPWTEDSYNIDDTDLFARMYLKEQMFSKYLDSASATPQQCYDKGLKKLLASEYKCSMLNSRGLLNENLTHDAWDYIKQRAKTIISQTIGVTPDYSMFEKASFGTGATTCRTMKRGDPFYKYNTSTSGSAVDVTYTAYPYAVALIRQTPLWDSAGAVANINICMGNHVFSVLKKSDEFRLACKEPGLNALLQAPVGRFFRSRLLTKHSIDLRNQTVNQALAQIGSQTGLISTLDLKNASNSISQRVIYEFFPIDWVNFLDSLRSTWGFLPDGPTSNTGKWIKWQMHSTMGNGYTFEMESLLFFALVKACTDFIRTRVAGPFLRHDVSVYGDDIICPTYSSLLVIEVLAICGFETNSDKSFISGPFRESCGKHYHKGTDVTPFYIRKPINTVSRMLWYLNALKRWGAIDGIADPRTYGYWRALKRKYVPSLFYGGVNSHSVTSLHSNGEKGCSISMFQPKREITGIPAVLRAFQYQSRMVHHDHITWLEIPDPDTYVKLFRNVKAERLSDMYLNGYEPENDSMYDKKKPYVSTIPDFRRNEMITVKVNHDIIFDPIYYPAELGCR